MSENINKRKLEPLYDIYKVLTKELKARNEGYIVTLLLRQSAVVMDKNDMEALKSIDGLSGCYEDTGNALYFRLSFIKSDNVLKTICGQGLRVAMYQIGFDGLQPLRVKFSYNGKFGEDGTVYRQMINVSFFQEQLDKLNSILERMGKETAIFNLKNGIKSLGSLKDGDNYTTLTVRDYLVELMGLKYDKNLKDVNTIFRVNVVKKVKI